MRNPRGTSGNPRHQYKFCRARGDARERARRPFSIESFLAGDGASSATFPRQRGGDAAAHVEPAVGQPLERGDADLDLETSFTGDFRIEAHNDRGRIEWAGFVTQYDDYIFAALTGNDVDEDGALGGDLAELAYTSRDALFYGFEISGDLELLENDFGTLGIDGRFDYVRARFDGNGSGGSNNVPRITPLRWGAGLWFDHGSTNARVGFIRNEAQDETGDSETNTKSYTFVEASITHTWEIDEDKALDFSIAGQNLTDVRARNAGGCGALAPKHIIETPDASTMLAKIENK